MINFQVSAPGKLNLFGEYLTCNDHNGVMASIDQRNTVTFNELPRSEDAIKLNVAEINLYCTIRLRRFQNFYRRCTFDDTLSEQILQFIFVEHLWVDGSDQKNIGHALIYLLAYVTYNENIDIEDVTPFEMNLEVLLPTVSFGGLASIVVCFTACFLRWSYLRRDDHHELNDNDRAKISMYSKSCDKIFNYCMFKSDVTVSTYGGILRYRCCNDSSQNDVLRNMPNMSVLLIDTNTSLNVSEMSRLKEKVINSYPSITNPILNSIRVITDTAFLILAEINELYRNDPTYSQDVVAQENKLLPLVRMQQELSTTFMNPDEPMETICEIARRMNLAGKCADFNSANKIYVWCPEGPDIFNENMMLIRNNFVTRSFNSITLRNLNCNGVQII